MNIKKNKNQFIISVIIGIAIFGLTFLVFSAQQQQIDELKKARTVPVVTPIRNNYVLTKTELKKGTAITDENIEIKTVPVNEATAFANKQDVVGLVLVKDIDAGQILKKEFFSEDDLPSNFEPQKGFRAISLVMTAKSYTPPLRPDTYIDLYSTGGSIVIENARVLDLKKGGTGAKTEKVVVLEIKEDNVSSLVNVIAEDKESFIIVQKNQADDKTYRFKYRPPVNELDVMRGSLSEIAPPSNVVNYNIEEFTINEAPKQRETVEIIRGTNKTECEF